MGYWYGTSDMGLVVWDIGMRPVMGYWYGTRP